MIPLIVAAASRLPPFTASRRQRSRAGRISALAFVAGGIALAGCPAPTTQPTVTSGDGVNVKNGVVSVDQTKVPDLSSCAAGQVVARTSTGWECVTPAQPPAMLQAGDGISLENNTVSARFGTGHTDVAAGDHNHDAVYRKKSDPVGWSDVAASSTDVWPGTVPYAALTNAPADLAKVATQVAASQPRLHVASASDPALVSIIGGGLVSQSVVSTFTFANMPAGSVLVTVEVPYAVSVGGWSGGGLILTANGTEIGDMATNTSYNNVGGGYPLWTARSISGVLPDFPGGTVTVTLYVWGDSSATKLEFGTSANEARFARRITVIGGL